MVGTAMTNPRLDRVYKSKGSTPKFEEVAIGGDPQDLTLLEKFRSEVLEKRYGSQSVVNGSFLHPLRIMAATEETPMMAAQICHLACRDLNAGHQRRLREYLCVGFYIARKFIGRPNQIKFLTEEVIDNRRKSGFDPAKVENSLLHYLFIYIFHQSGLVTRDRATRYAEALQPYFDSNLTYEEVRHRLLSHGPTLLYKAAGKWKTASNARDLADRPSQITASLDIDEIVADLLKEKAAIRQDNATLADDDQSGRSSVNSLGGVWINPNSSNQPDLPAELPNNEPNLEHNKKLVDGTNFLKSNSGSSDGTQDQNKLLTEGQSISDDLDETIDGEVIDSNLGDILLKAMLVGEKISKKNLDSTQQKDAFALTVSLCSDIVALRNLLFEV
ncbi:hypothetical protein MKK75_11120 [Methylobacterium sp. J-030]|uniref:hypothetical protein n=1 Tax=Methylobacterium sp. J-030 TaxID=2836627 RepID=UPI001FBBD878|nr:hypothetical protein [Methylobacterium sp. J-030]MCJ2069345.1 hypothetical protein [Methylobacterium sp. J-030]